MSSDDNLSLALPLGLRMVMGTGPAVTPHLDVVPCSSPSFLHFVSPLLVADSSGGHPVDRGSQAPRHVIDAGRSVHHGIRLRLCTCDFSHLLVGGGTGTKPYPLFHP